MRIIVDDYSGHVAPAALKKVGGWSASPGSLLALSLSLKKLRQETSIETLLLAVTAFASTNIEDAFVLLAFFGEPQFKGRDVIVGQYTGMAALTVAASHYRCSPDA